MSPPPIVPIGDAALPFLRAEPRLLPTDSSPPFSAPSSAPPLSPPPVSPPPTVPPPPQPHQPPALRPLQRRRSYRVDPARSASPSSASSASPSPSWSTRASSPSIGMAMDAAPMLKRKGAEALEELWLDEDPASGFPVSSRATKIRRLDAEVMPPVVPTAGVPPQPQPVARFGVEEVPMCGDVAPTANEERAIVVYNPPRSRAASCSARSGRAFLSALAPNGSTGSRDANGLGLQAVGGEDYCRVVIRYPSDTVSKWIDPKTGEAEGLSFEFNLCEAVVSWEQVRNSTTILTKEYIDALPNGWEEYAWHRINKGILLNKCQNRTLCMEKLSLVLPKMPPYVPHQFGRCAVVGNPGDLLKTKFGDEIDSYDVVILENGAPIQNYTEYVGTKSTFRLLNRGSAKALDKVVELDETNKEVLIVKTTIHDIMNQMIRELPIINPIYLMLGTSFGSSAKGTGLKALEFALSICDNVDMYGFTVDPGYNK